MISTNLSRQAPPGLDIRRSPAPAATTLPQDQFTASEGGSDDEKSRLIFAGVGLVVAVGAAAGAIWVTNNVDVPETPPVSIETPITTRERVEPQPIIPRHQAPVRQHRPQYQPQPQYQREAPRFTPPGQTTRIDSDGNVTVPLGNSGVSIDTQGRTSVDLGPATLRSDGTTDVRLGDRLSIRSDGTTGVRLNENMTIRSDGSLEWHLGGRR